MVSFLRNMKVLMDKVLSLNINYTKLLKISLILIFVGAFMSFLFVPQLVKIIIKQITMLKPGHFVRKRHEDKLLFSYKLYLWNVTNPSQITAGIEKPKMQEIGPYVFSQFKRKVDTADNNTEDTFNFNLWNIYHFNPQLSEPLTGNETVTLLNMVLVAGLMKIKIERPHLIGTAAEGMDLIFKNPSSIFVTMKAMEFIDIGFLIDCNQSQFSGKAVCRELRENKNLKIIDGDKTRLRYRWFDKLNNSIQARYKLLRGSKNIYDTGRVVGIDEKPMQNVYKQDEKCNVINGTDKTFFAPFQRKEETMWAYSHDACLSVPLVYKYMTTLRGTRVAYKNVYLSDPLLSPTCNCNQYTGCNSIKGTFDLTPCVELFVLGSLPHFYSAEPSIREAMQGMNPNEKLHQTGIYFNLLTGIPILSLERIQVNFLVRRIPEYPLMSSIADGDVWIPVLWYDESFTPLKPDLALIIFSGISKNFGVISGYLLMCLGAVGCIMTIVVRNKRDISKVLVAAVQPATPISVNTIEIRE